MIINKKTVSTMEFTQLLECVFKFKSHQMRKLDNWQNRGKTRLNNKDKDNILMTSVEAL